jgi:hypothetical protein
MDEAYRIANTPVKKKPPPRKKRVQERKIWELLKPKAPSWRIGRAQMMKGPTRDCGTYLACDGLASIYTPSKPPESVNTVYNPPQSLNRKGYTFTRAVRTPEYEQRESTPGPGAYRVHYTSQVWD